jgi:peptidoglycan hydrolase-like protein with peptidoglycan-binding domain
MAKAKPKTATATPSKKAPSWRVAKSLDVLLKQVNEQAPGRSKVSDGSIGDEKHQASKSDHNKNAAGVVQARDFTHDPADGFDSYKFSETLRTKKDPRIKYVISNYRIFSGNAGPSPWVWRKYTGSNPHSMHGHVSVVDDAKSYDDASEWDIGQTAFVQDPEAAPLTLPKLRVGDEGFYVQMMQVCLRFQEEDADGEYGVETKAAVQQFQRDHKLDADGIVGPYTWRELLRPWAEEVKLIERTPPVKVA